MKEPRNWDWTDVVMVLAVVLLAVSLITGDDTCTLRIRVGDEATTTTAAAVP